MKSSLTPSLSSDITSSGWPSFSKYLVKYYSTYHAKVLRTPYWVTPRVCNLRGLGPAWVYVSIYGNEMVVFPLGSMFLEDRGYVHLAHQFAT